MQVHPEAGTAGAGAGAGAGGGAGGGLTKLTIVLIVGGIVLAVVVVATVIAVAVVLTANNDDSGSKKNNNNDDVFTCNDGTELDGSRQCDGYQECEDGEDEEDCSCGSHESACSSDGTCIWDDWFCDGTVDCSEGEDEEDGTCGITCGAAEFECADHDDCVANTVLCDQTDDCGDGSDEWNCLKIEEIDGDDVLLVNYQGNYLPVCMENWDSAWNDDVCTEMGFGTADSQSGIAASDVPSYTANGYIEAASGGTITASALEVLNTQSGTCATGEIVTLTCTYDECGTRGRSVSVTTGQETIIQGYRAQDGAWPWQVAVQVFGSQICGGSIIANNWILTAAHCAEYPVSYYSVRVGSNKVSGDDTYVQEVDVEELFLHEDYDSATIENDIALIKLESNLIYDDYVRPVCLPDSSEDWSDSVVCYTSGWGAWESSASRYPDLLQETKMPLISDDDCNDDADITAVGGIEDDQMQCAGYPGGYITTCSGDSGGPLVCRDKRNVWTLAGATSWGVGTQDNPCLSLAVYADVPAYADWIAATMVEDEEL